ncbi:MAG: hypothetical protein K2I92_04575 [Muribaculaceae bacterium]|nr:hypothetical protein [Muribaculaceae bacterium]
MKKAQESVSVAVLRFEASRIALSKSDGNAEAHAKICNMASGSISHETACRRQGITIHGHPSLLNP